MTPPLARYPNWLASNGGAWITDSPRLWLRLALRPRDVLRLALPGSQTRLAARVAEPPRPPIGSPYHRLGVSPDASSARPASSAAVSLWGAPRVAGGPVAGVVPFPR